MDKSFTWIKTLNLDPKSIQTDAMNKIQIHIISMTSKKIDWILIEAQKMQISNKKLKHSKYFYG